MVTKLQEKHTHTKQNNHRPVIPAIKKGIKTLGMFWIKFNNDWSWNNAAGLAYNLMLSMFHLVIALLAILNASLLFLFIEGSLDISYHVRPRGIIAQNVVAIVMLLLFIVLIPLAIFASAVPAFIVSFLPQDPLSQVPVKGILLGISGIVGGLIAGYILFQAIYMIVPNQKISFRHSWPGAVVAAVLLELYLALFPLYVTFFLGSFAGALDLLILLIFFYYFAMILFLGAEVNAFFAVVRNTPYDLATL